MKARVKISFVDKYTGSFYKENQIIELTPQRVKEIKEVGDLIEIINDPKPIKKELL